MKLTARLLFPLGYLCLGLGIAAFTHNATAQTALQKQDILSIVKEKTARPLTPTQPIEPVPVDCINDPAPRIERMPAEFRPGDTFVIEGHCFKGHQPVRFYFTGSAAIQPYTTTGAASELSAQSNNRRIVLQIAKGLPRINSGDIKIEVATPRGVAQGNSMFVNK
jgi:hypothetical protein